MKQILLTALSVLALCAQAQTFTIQPRRCLHSIDPSIDAVPASQAATSIRRGLSTSTDDGLGSYGESAGGTVRSVSHLRLPVVMVAFSDMPFQETTTRQKVDRLFNENGYHDEEYCVGSVRDYFIDNSDGLFVPDFVVVDSIVVDRSYAYYGANSGNNHNVNVLDLVVDAANKCLRNGVDFMQFVDSEIGAVPMLILYFAGPGENAVPTSDLYGSAASKFDGLIWPHYRAITIGNTTLKFASYNMCNELRYRGFAYNDDRTEIIGQNPIIDGVGVSIHEFCHGLGLPDFYSTTSEVPQSPEYWSIMDYGPYLQNGYRPVGMNAYEKSYLGWLQVEELTEAKAVTLESGQAALIRTDDSTGHEYYLLENRQDGTWTPAAGYGSGLLVMHVDFDADVWLSNRVNGSAAHPRCYVIPADNTWTPITSQDWSWATVRGDLFGYAAGSPTSITATTSPSWENYSGSVQPVYDIRKEGNNIVFSFIEEGISTAITGVSTDTDRTADAYLLDGRRATNHTRGIIIQNGRKLIR